MDGSFLINVVARFLHVAAAAVGVGATIALLVAARGPAAATGAYDALRAGLKRWVHVALGLGVVTGLYTYLVVSIPAVRGSGDRLSAYHPLMGVKILLALAFFAFNFQANGRAQAQGEARGFVKVLADEATDRILGVHMIGPHVSELLGEAVVAMEFVAAAEDLARICHAQPTLSEALHEAALAAIGRPLHQ